MNEMVFQLQPEIIVNNRNKLDGDFATRSRESRPSRIAPGIVHDHER